MADHLGHPPSWHLLWQGDAAEQHALVGLLRRRRVLRAGFVQAIYAAWPCAPGRVVAALDVDARRDDRRTAVGSSSAPLPGS